MNNRIYDSCRLLFFWLLLVIWPSTSWPEDWNITGANTLRLENYESRGLADGNPYPFEDGQFFDEFNINFAKRKSVYELWRGQIYGVLNDSEYRASDKGFVPERLGLAYEKGDVAIPYRVHLGDFFGYFSYLTLQRSLKGVQVELQPRIDRWGQRHSIMFLTGVNSFQWRGIDLRDDISIGASWLIDSTHFGVLNFNLVHNYQQGDPKAGLLDRFQYVLSAGYEKEFSLAGQQITLETEFAYMHGDHEGISGPASGQGKGAEGFSLDLSGRHIALPLTYRFRSEYYERDFRPAGAVVTADRRSLELHGGWRFASGVQLRSRLQVFEDGFDSTVSTVTRTAGLNVSGPFNFGSMSGLSGNVDAYIQDMENDTLAIDATITTFSAALNKRLSSNWLGRLIMYAQGRKDHSVADADIRTNQATFSLDYTFRFGGFNGIIAPGVQLRSIDGSGKSDDWNPTLSLHLDRGSHSLGFSYGYAVLDRHTAGYPDIITQTAALDYRYQWRQNTLGLELDVFDREQSLSMGTDAYAIGVFWTYNFDNQVKKALRKPSQYPTGYESPRMLRADLFDLGPNVLLDDAEVVLDLAGISGVVYQGALLIYEYPLLDGIDQRQRLVLNQTGGVLDGAALIIEFDDVGSREAVAQTFERVRQKLIERYGSPSFSFEDGEFSESFIIDINAKRMIRVDEWQTSRGVLRFGIPRRLDGQVRMEIQHRRSFTQPRDTLWSIEAVR